MNPKLSVLIPMYNEKKNAEKTALSLSSYLDSKFPDGNYEIVFSDDGSNDGCAELIKKLSLPSVRVVGYTDNRGKGSAIREGIFKCNGDFIVYTDCDLAYGCEAIYGIYEALSKCDSELMIGSRNMRDDGYDGYTAIRKLMSKTYIKFISLLAGFNHSDSQCGIKCIRSHTAKEIYSKCTVNGFAFDLEVLILAEKLGKKISEFPVKIVNHDEANSKVNPIKDTVNMIRDVARIKKYHRETKSQ